MKLKNQLIIRNQQRGASLLEYGALLSLLIILTIASVKQLGKNATKPLCGEVLTALSSNQGSQYTWVTDSSYSPGDRPDCLVYDGYGGDTSVWY